MCHTHRSPPIQLLATKSAAAAAASTGGIRAPAAAAMNTDITASTKPEYPVVDRNPAFTKVVGNFSALDYMRLSTISAVSVTVGYLSGSSPSQISIPNPISHFTPTGKLKPGLVVQGSSRGSGGRRWSPAGSSGSWEGSCTPTRTLPDASWGSSPTTPRSRATSTSCSEDSSFTLCPLLQMLSLLLFLTSC